LRQKLLEVFPLPQGLDPLSDSVPIKPKWLLGFAEPGGDSTRQTVQHDQDLPPDDLIAIPNSLVGTIHSNTRVTPTSHFQDTRHIILTIPGRQEYPPGAVLTVYPKNFPSDVTALLDLMSWTSVADKPLKFVPTKDGLTSSHNYAPPPLSVPSLSLRSLLTNHLDIMAIPRRSFFGNLLHYTEDEMHLERLREFTSPELVDELYDYTTRPRRSILEVLADLPAVKIPWQEVCSVIPMMRGRQFSIASGGLLKEAQSLKAVSSVDTSDTRVDLLIAIVKYRTIIKRLRQGVATRYIGTLRAGQRITVTLQMGGLGLKEDDMQKPVVMVGPGTGVAPMRALAYERLKWRTSDPSVTAPKDLLFYGCRNKDVDEYFGSEWKDLDVDVRTAYSRDQVGLCHL
jgi:sulfite reductase alpha subunit-like flavoprotein